MILNLNVDWHVASEAKYKIITQFNMYLVFYCQAWDDSCWSGKRQSPKERICACCWKVRPEWTSDTHSRGLQTHFRADHLHAPQQIPGGFWVPISPSADGMTMRNTHDGMGFKQAGLRLGSPTQALDSVIQRLTLHPQHGSVISISSHFS